ncbi:hypothetical protein GCM10027589_46530 [Actinocorallia lasiicapitis]
MSVADELPALVAEYPQWRFWHGFRSDGRPGDLMAVRRRRLSDAELGAGLAMTLPMGVFGPPLAEQLARQRQIEERAAGVGPAGDAREHSLPFGVASGMMVEALREALMEYGLLRSGVRAIIFNASARFERLFDELGAPDRDDEHDLAG